MSRKALITGGAQGIGYASAEAMAEDGYEIILADIQREAVQDAVARLGGSG